MTKLLIILLIILIFLCIYLPSSNCSISDIGQKIIRRSFGISNQNPNVTILMMFPDIDDFIPNLKSLLIVYEYIVHRYQISKWLNINLQVKDSNCSISLAPHMLVTTMLSTIPDVVFGPFCGKYQIFIYFFCKNLFVIFRFSSSTCCSSSSFSKYSCCYNGSCFE